MEKIKIDDSNKDKPQETSKLSLDQNKTKNKYISMMNEEETSLWVKKLNLNENILAELGKVIKNGKDLISIYDNKKIFEKLNIDFHSINIIKSAIEEGLEEQLQINILIQKGKNIILNVENEPKFKLKEILSYLEKLMKKTVYLTPLNSPNELLTPNSLIVKKILLNPNKYCNLQIFDEKTIENNNNINLNRTNVGESNTKNIPYKKIENFNINKKEISYLNDNDNLNNINNINQNNNNLNLVNTNQNLNDPKISSVGKGYISLFQNKKNNMPDFTTDYKMPGQSRINANNYIKIEKKNITPSKPIEDFKYQNLLSMKDKEEKDNNNNIVNDLRYLKDNNINDAKNIGFKNISNVKNIENSDNELNSINKNYFTQRNFNSKTMSNDPNNNNLMFQQILNKKRSEKNLSDMMEKKTIENLEEDNINLSFLERNKNKEKDIFKFGKENKDIKKQINNKTENRYEFARFQDLDKDNLFGNKNTFNFSKTNPENNDIDNLIIKTQNVNINKNSNEELTNSKDKYLLHNDNDNNLKGEAESDLLKGLREKYSLNSFNKDNKEVDNNKINMEIKKDYKPKTPINETRRNIPDSIRFNNFGNDNSNNILENKFLMRQNEEFSKFNNFLNNNNNLLKIQLQQQQEEDDDNNNNFITKIKMDNKINNNKLNRPSPGLEFKPFQYQTSGYKSSIQPNQQNDSNQFALEDE